LLSAGNSQGVPRKPVFRWKLSAASFSTNFPAVSARGRIGDQVHAERHRIDGLRTDFEGAVGVAVRRHERLADLRDQRRPLGG